jgi:hypothetical protein
VLCLFCEDWYSDNGTNKNPVRTTLWFKRELAQEEIGDKPPVQWWDLNPQGGQKQLYEFVVWLHRGDITAGVMELDHGCTPNNSTGAVHRETEKKLWRGGRRRSQRPEWLRAGGRRAALRENARGIHPLLNHSPSWASQGLGRRQ